MASATDSAPKLETPPRVVEVSLQPTGHLYNCLAGDFELRRGDRVLIESETGLTIATVARDPYEAARPFDLAALRPIVRPLTETDLETEAEILRQEARARRLCLERIRESGLPMKLVKVQYAFDGRKAVFYFVAESRLDFRGLVRDLAATLRVRADMKQIGARDETKIAGALGPCGRELCCASWLRDFEAVTVKMAREQGLALYPSRLAGMCGRLKCCLRFEYATYVELRKGLPAAGKRVQSVKGDGKVLRQNVLRQTVLIQRDNDGGVVEATLEDLVAPRAPEAGGG